MPTQRQTESTIYRGKYTPRNRKLKVTAPSANLIQTTGITGFFTTRNCPALNAKIEKSMDFTQHQIKTVFIFSNWFR